MCKGFEKIFAQSRKHMQRNGRETFHLQPKKA